MRSRRILLATVALIALLSSGCTSDDQPDETAKLPDATELLNKSAEATKKLTSTHFNLQVNGQVAGLGIQGADGELTTEGEQGGAAKGTVTLNQGGQLVEMEFVLAGGELYIEGPTGGFAKLPAAMAAQLYNPATILDPDKGVARLLANVSEAKTVAAEDVAGTPTYKVSGTVSQDVVTGLVPSVRSDVDVTLWLRQDGEHLPVKASVAVPGENDQVATVVVTLSEFNEPVTITPPN